MVVKKIGMVLLAGACTWASAQNCNDAQGVYGVMTSLGLGTLGELGRAQPLTDYAIVGGKLALTAEGLQRCATVATDNCVIVKAMLGLQNDELQYAFVNSDFSTAIYRQRLLTQFQRQQVAAQRPATDPNRAWAAPHFINADSLRYEEGGCGGVYILHPVSSETSEVVTAAQMCSQMVFVGSQGTMAGDICVSDNPYLDISTRDYTATGFTFVVDPPEKIVNWNREAVAGPVESCVYVDPTGSAQGVSCECNGYAGALQAVNTENTVFSCRQ